MASRERKRPEDCTLLQSLTSRLAKLGSRRTAVSFKLLQHLLGNVLVAGLGPVIAVVGQEAACLVVRIVLLPVLDERLAQVIERNLLLLGDGTGGFREGIKL